MQIGIRGHNLRVPIFLYFCKNSEIRLTEKRV